MQVALKKKCCEYMYNNFKKYLRNYWFWDIFPQCFFFNPASTIVRENKMLTTTRLRIEGEGIDVWEIGVYSNNLSHFKNDCYSVRFRLRCFVKFSRRRFFTTYTNLYTFTFYFNKIISYGDSFTPGPGISDRRRNRKVIKVRLHPLF